MTKFLGWITVLAVVIGWSFLNCLLAAHIFIDIAKLYNITFITGFSFLQVVGLFFTLSLLLYKYKEAKKEEDNSISAAFLRASKQLLTATLFYLVSWGSAILFFNILS